MATTRTTHVKMALMLGACAVIATLALQPFLVMTEPAVMSKLRVPFFVIAVLQGGLPNFFLGWLGLSLGSQYGLDAPWLRAFVDPSRREPVIRTRWGLAALTGFVAGALVEGLNHMGPSVLPPTGDVSPLGQAWRGALASLYGGTAEEILMRLFLVTLFVWVFALFNRRQARPCMFVFAIALAALLFGAAHLGYAFSVGISHTPLLIGKIVLLNALVGWVTGTLFWKYGLEHAMLAHFCADLVLHVATPFLSP